VARVGHFSGYAGAFALAVIVVPVVVRTTEDMLRLVPDPLREAASALGLPRSHVIGKVAYRAARADPADQRDLRQQKARLSNSAENLNTYDSKVRGGRNENSVRENYSEEVDS
jgi:hypothetical protein